LRDGKDALAVNWIGVTISDAKGKVTYCLPSLILRQISESIAPQRRR
jgi:hypothetical protein